MNLKLIGEKILRESEEKIPVIKKIIDENLVDLVILTGSFVKQNFDDLSDVDLFFVLPFKIQNRYKIKPEYSFYSTLAKKNTRIEISFVTTEKLLTDQRTKINIFWWNNAVCIFSKNKNLYSAFKKAGVYSKNELRDKLWTLNFQFKLGMYDFEKNFKRFNQINLTNSIVYYDNLRIFTEFYLLTKGCITRFSSFDKEIQKTEPDFFLESAHRADTYKGRQEVLVNCSNLIDIKLFSFGFKKSDILNWNQFGLSYLMFQKF